jgi:alpha-tubulin suppressor-like RCC1 family protein
MSALIQQSSFFGDTNYIQYEPRKFLYSSKFNTVSCSPEYALGLTYDGKVYGWGKGYLKNAQNNEPQPMNFPNKIVSISSGTTHSAAVDVEGMVYTWGFGGSQNKGAGQLGHNSMNSEDAPR